MSSSSFSLSGLLSSLLEAWPTIGYLLGGAGTTCLLILAAMLIGLVMGTVMASGQVYGPPWAGRLVGLYVWFFRGVPILVLMFLFHFGLAGLLETAAADLARSDLAARLFGARLNIRPRVSPFVSAAAVLGLCSAAYQSQIFRGAMQSIPVGQFRAALALGMSRRQAVAGVILPQALRLSIPAWSNEYSILLKDSAIAYVVGVSEIMSRFKAVASASHRYLLLYVLAGLLYYLLTAIGVRLLDRLRRRVRTPGLGESDAAGY
jgi:polar amino acid transport system permease protein